MIGKPATQFITGGGSGNVTPFALSDALDAIRARAGTKTNVVYDDGTDAARAAALARRSSVALVFGADYQTEGIDRRCLSLECPPWLGDQDALIERGRRREHEDRRRARDRRPRPHPVALQGRGDRRGLVPGRARRPGDRADAVRRHRPGRPPARHLPPLRSPTSRPPAIPTGTPASTSVQHYSEGVLVGYRWWDAKKKTPAYPFGSGRSYTSFAMKGLRTKKLKGGRLAVSIDVRNTGKRRGVAVPQLYVGIPSPRAGVNEPPRQLKAFRKFRLARHAHKRVHFTLPARSFAYWEERTNGWKVAKGCYRIMVGPTSRNIARTKRVGLRGGRCR